MHVERRKKSHWRKRMSTCLLGPKENDITSPQSRYSTSSQGRLNLGTMASFIVTRAVNLCRLSCHIHLESLMQHLTLSFINEIQQKKENASGPYCTSSHSLPFSATLQEAFLVIASHTFPSDHRHCYIQQGLGVGTGNQGNIMEYTHPKCKIQAVPWVLVRTTLTKKLWH